MAVPGNDSVDNTLILGNYILTAYCIVYIVLLPVFIFVMYLGFQQRNSWPPTHTDVFTFNMAILEVIGVVSAFIAVSSIYAGVQIIIGVDLAFMTAAGQTVFHLLVCLERFLAVVHPITYLRLKQKGVAMRNVSIVLTWLLSFGVAILGHYKLLVCVHFAFIVGLLSLMAITFCCVRVLFVLIRPGPGDRSGGRGHVDQTKRRAFYIIAAITVALLLKFFTMSVGLVANLDGITSQAFLISVCGQWFSIPSSLVLPVPFLCRRVRQGKSNQ